MKSAAIPERIALRLTPLGQAAIVACLLMAILLVLGGGRASLIVVAAAGLAAPLTAALVARWQVRGLSVEPVGPASVFAGRRFALDVTVSNDGPWVARDLAIHCGEPGSLDHRQAAGYVSACEPQAMESVTVQHGALSRGRHAQLPLTLVSGYPFGLVACTAFFQVPADVLVLPRVGSVANLERFSVSAGGLDLSGTRDRLGEEEFHGLREWREGESLRRVHWKLTARRGRRVIRELRSAGRFRVHVVLTTDAIDGADIGLRGPLERAIGLAATLSEHYLRRGHPVRLSVVGQVSVTADRRRGRAALFPLLAALAQVAPASESDPTAALDRIASRPDEVVLHVSPGGALQVPGARRLDVTSPAMRRTFRRALSSGAVRRLGIAG